MSADQPLPSEHIDVLIVGAGISGIGAAVHLQRDCPTKTFALLETKEAFGGTWRQHTWRQHSARETPATPCLMSDRHLGRPSGAPPLDYVSPHTSHLSSLTSHVPPLCLPLKHLSSICLSHLRNPAHTPSEKQEERGVGGGREGGREGGRT